MPLSSQAKKLILLLMDGAPPLPEREVAVHKLIARLRKDYPDGFALLADWNNGNASPPTPPPPPRASGESPYGRFIIGFGKHKGEMLKDIPVAYLLYVLDWPDLYPRTRTAIEKFLEQES